MSNDKDVALSVKLSADDTEIQKALAGLKQKAEDALHAGVAGPKVTEAMAEIEAGTKAMAAQFGTAAANAHRALDTIGLGAEAQVPRLQRMVSGFQSFTGKLGQGINAIDSFAKTLGPWNQALELGGKAVKFVSDGLDAYAKTSPEAKAEVEKLTKEFGHLKESAMAAFGAMAVEVLKPLPGLKEMNALLAQQQKMADRIAALKAGGGGAGDVFGQLLSESRGADVLTRILSGEVASDIKKVFSADTWNTVNVDGALERVKKGIDDARESQKAAATEARAWAAELAKLADSEAKKLTDDLVKRLEGDVAALPKGVDFEGTQDRLRAVRQGIEEMNAAVEAARAAQAKKGLENIGKFAGKIETDDTKGDAFLKRMGLADPSGLDVAATALQGFADTYSSAMEQMALASGSAGEAVRAGLGAMVAGVGRKLLAYGAAELVESGAHLVLGDFAGAAQHAGAAALYTAGGFAAFRAAKELGYSGSAGAAGAGSAGAAGGEGASSGDGRDHRTGADGPLSETKVIRETIVAYASPFAQETERMKKRQAELIVQRTTGGQAWSND